MKEKAEQARNYSQVGYNCCQAVACSFCKEISVDEETLFKAGEAFGLGMGGMEGTCGAVSGAVMLAGFKNSDGQLNDPKTKERSKEGINGILNKYKAIISVCWLFVKNLKM